MPVITRSMTKKMAVAEVVHQEPSESEPSLWPSITDLPPEVLEMILTNLDCGRNSMLPYRLVSPTWKSIIDDLLQKKTLKGDVDGCPTFLTSAEWPIIRSPGEVLLHNGNPFPSSSLTITRRRISSELGIYPPFRYNRSFRLDDFMSKVGSHLTTFIMKSVSLDSTENLCQTLAHLPNLKTLNLRCIDILNMEDEEALGSLPVLPHLSRLEIYSIEDYWNRKNQKFYAWFVGAYAEQLEYLSLAVAVFGKRQVHPFPQRPASSLKSSPMQKLRHLKILYASAKFFQLSCSPPLLHHLYIGKLHFSEEMNLAVLMDFVDKFSNTLETLDLDIEWSELSCRRNWFREGDGNLLDMMLQRFYDEDGIRTGREPSATTAPVFPKLTKLTFPYPSNFVESAVLSKLILPKFPALCELKLGYIKQVFGYRDNLDKDEFRQRHGPTIKDFLMKEGYWKLCNNLTLISVWHSGEGFVPCMNSDRPHRPNFLVLSVRREDDEK